MKWTAAAYTPSGFFRHERAVGNRSAANASRSLQWICLIGPLGIGKRVAARVFHNWSKEARGQQASRLVHLWKDRLTAAVGQPAFWALGKSGGLTPPYPTQGSLEKGRGLVPGKTKSDVEVAVSRVEVAAVRRTHPPRAVGPRTTAKGVSAGRN